MSDDGWRLNPEINPSLWRSLETTTIVNQRHQAHHDGSRGRHCTHRTGYTLCSADRQHFPGPMPWKKNSEPEQRWGLIQLVLRAQLGLAELCRGSGISRKTTYKWLARFKEQGRQGLRNQTRCAHRS